MYEEEDILFDAWWADQTVIHPLGLTALIIAAVGVLFLPRRWAIAPVFVLACFVSPVQRLVVWEIDFDFFRILALVGWLRLLLRSEYHEMKWTRLDIWISLQIVAGTTIFIISRGAFDAFINGVGRGFDALGLYFLVRHLIRSEAEIRRFGLLMAAVALPVAAFFVLEKQTGRNIFSIFGGVPEYTLVRRGELRCQGAFVHPIIAGCFWVGLLPVMIHLARFGKTWVKILAGSGIISALIVVWACASSTPMAGVAAVILGTGLFGLRYRTRLLTWLAVGGVVFLQLLMAAPIWHLFVRVRIIGGSTGYHRFMLIDQFVKRFGEWALLGTPTTEHWGRGLIDVTCHYIAVGIGGGVISLALFIGVIVVAHRSAIRCSVAAGEDRARADLSWALLTTVFAHSIMFMAVSYFGQGTPLWIFHLAVIGVLASKLPVATPVLNERASVVPDPTPLRPAPALPQRPLGV
ncbi:MAG: hypothetical protein AAF333_00595 [Planctomycetota bacterium]